MRKTAVLAIGSVSKNAQRVVEYDDFVLHRMNTGYKYFSAKQPTHDFLKQKYQDIIEYVKDHGVSYVFGTSDTAELLAAVIRFECSLPGPSLRSVLLCCNKYEMRRILEGASSVFPITPDTDVSTLEYPFFLKAPFSSFGLYATVVRNPNQLNDFLRTYWPELQQRNDCLRTLCATAYKDPNYQYFFEDMFYGEKLRSGLAQVTCEGVVANGILHPVTIVDSNMSADGRVFDSFTLPSRVPQAIATIMWQMVSADIKKIGLDNTGFNVEFWWNEAGLVDLIEINCRSAYSFKYLYRAACNYDVETAAYAIAMQRYHPPILPSLDCIYGLYNIRVKTGQPVSEVCNISEARMLPEVHMRYGQNYVPKQNGHYGDVIADVLIAAKTYSDFLQKGQEYERRLCRS